MKTRIIALMMAMMPVCGMMAQKITLGSCTTKDGGQYIPMPSTWLNGKRWEDEAPKAQGLIHEVSAHQYSQRDYTEEELEARTTDLINEAMGL